MTGALLDVQASSGQLFSVYDGLTGDLMVVADISGIPILTVNSNGVIYENSASYTGLSAANSPYYLLYINVSTGSAAWFDYRVNDTVTGAYRAGTVMTVWNGATATNTEYTDTSTPDLIASTAGIEFSTGLSGTNVRLIATVTSGTWNVKIGTRAI